MQPPVPYAYNAAPGYPVSGPLLSSGPPPEKPGGEPEYAIHITPGKLFFAMGIAFTNAVGVYLYHTGYEDFGKGLARSGNAGGCSWLPLLTFLAYAAPLCCLLRVPFAPAIWKHLVDDQNPLGALTSLPVLVWCFLFFAPFLPLLYMLLQPGFGDLSDPEATIANWPRDCAVDRPFHGLLQTRCWALLGAYATELGWHMMVIATGRRADRRVCSLSMPCMMFTLFMLWHGPLRFLRGYAGEPCPDLWIEYTYVLVSISCFLGHTALIFLFLPRAAAEARSAFGPLLHWSTLIWMAVLVLQVAVLKYVLPRAQEIKKGAPWEACGVDYKEFFFPRHLGLIFFLYSQFCSFPCTLVGCWLWGQ